jgi:competence protein ComEA
MTSSRSDADQQQRPPILAWALLAALIASVLAAALAMVTTRPAPVTLIIAPPPSPAPSSTPAPPVVYVTGAVAQPGVYTLAVGDRVERAIAQAGGALANADLTRVNLAALVYDGDQIVVPARGEVLSAPPTATGPLAINTAPLDALLLLPGIGPATAQAIIAHRTANGPFRDMAALDLVEGIGPATLDALAGLIRFD